MGINLRFPSATGLGEIYVHTWVPSGTPIAIVQIAHGMAEHISRYDEFASFLNQNGILVVGNDHAGHGKSIGENAMKGYFGERDGWRLLMEDMRRLHDETAALYPDVPYILFGHSAGSFLARAYAAQYGEGIAAFIFSGTSGKNPAIPLGKLIVRLEVLRNGHAKPSKLLDKMSFGTYNKSFKPARTSFDWLSRDTAQVDAYVEDPLCGFIFTAEGMLDVLNVLDFVSGVGWAKNVPLVPVLLISGSEDPVGMRGRGVKQVCEWLRGTGHNVDCRLYEKCRHELLNEQNRYEIYRDILSFINQVLSK